MHLECCRGRLHWQQHLSVWQVSADYTVLIDAHREAKEGLEQAMATLKQTTEDIVAHGNGLLSAYDVACKHAMCALTLLCIHILDSCKLYHIHMIGAGNEHLITF